jgi:hypothetical protein
VTVRRRAVLLTVSLLLALASTEAVAQEPTAGRVLGAARGQVAWLDLSAPRPVLVSGIARPAYPVDVAATANVPFAVASVISPFEGAARPGGDLAAIDLETGAVTPLVVRAAEAESLDLPVIWPDGSSIVFQRSLIEQSNYQTRIERVSADGSNRTVLIDAARSPAPSPDGSSIAFVRVSDAGVALLLRRSDGSDFEVVPSGRFVAIAYPRFSPDGRQLAFAAITELRSPFRGAPASALLGAPLAHGFPYEAWLVGTDGQDLRQLPDVINDDASIAWSPDGSQLLVFGGWGSQLVDLASGAIATLPFLAGYGSIAWIPD